MWSEGSQLSREEISRRSQLGQLSREKGSSKCKSEKWEEGCSKCKNNKQWSERSQFREESRCRRGLPQRLCLDMKYKGSKTPPGSALKDVRLMLRASLECSPAAGTLALMIGIGDALCVAGGSSRSVHVQSSVKLSRIWEVRRLAAAVSELRRLQCRRALIESNCAGCRVAALS